MTYKTLMAHLSLSQPNAEVLRVVAHLGARFDCHLVGIAACQPMQNAYSEGYLGGEAMVACQDELKSELRQAEAEFREVLKGEKATLEWRSSYTPEALPYYLASEARCADLIITSVTVAGQVDSTRQANAADLLIQAGRPVLVVPQASARVPFESILVAWKDTRESRRAAVDAIPLLATAKDVTVLEIADEADLPTALGRAQDVSEWLRRHGVKAAPLALPSRGDHASHLDTVATELDCDLIVAGGYGHSRLREWTFGGVTHSLLKGGRCALLSH